MPHADFRLHFGCISAAFRLHFGFVAIEIPINGHHQPPMPHAEFQENSFVTKDCCIPGNRHHLPCHHCIWTQSDLTMNSVFCKCVLGIHVVWISTFPTLESQKTISVLSYCLIGLVEIPGIEFLPLDIPLTVVIGLVPMHYCNIHLLNSLVYVVL